MPVAAGESENIPYATERKTQLYTIEIDKPVEFQL